MEPTSPSWTPQLMIEAQSCLHEVLNANPEGTFDELLQIIVQSIAANLDEEIDVDLLTEFFSHN